VRQASMIVGSGLKTEKKQMGVGICYPCLRSMLLALIRCAVLASFQAGSLSSTQPVSPSHGRLQQDGVFNMHAMRRGRIQLSMVSVASVYWDGSSRERGLC
jgi:hypothetical protein